MKTFLECIPCFIKQTFDAASMSTSDTVLQEKILRRVLAEAADISFSQSPPEMARYIHGIIRKETGVTDPYRELKHLYNKKALDLYPVMKEYVTQSAEPLRTAVNLAIIGNIIDFGVQRDDHEIHVEREISENMNRTPGVNHLDELSASVEKAEQILYIGDNTGEIVFDRVLIETMGPERITFAVRSAPIINDVTMSDAQDVGITRLCTVIESGSDGPGTIMELCTHEFKNEFENADLVISKGQGNYETLSGISRNDLYFLLKAKCPVIARDISCDVGDFIVMKAGADKGGMDDGIK